VIYKELQEVVTQCSNFWLHRSFCWNASVTEIPCIDGARIFFINSVIQHEIGTLYCLIRLQDSIPASFGRCMLDASLEGCAAVCT
jgi:hypothetical protein